MKAKIKTACGVYALTIGAQRYIGGSRNVLRRMAEHRYRFRQKKQPKRLQAAYDAVRAFRFIILEQCAANRLKEREQWWLDHFQAARQGMNTYPIVDSPRGTSPTAEHRRKIGDALRGKPKPSGHGAKVSAALKGYKKTPAHLAQIRKSVIERSKDSEYRRNMREKNRKHGRQHFLEMFKMKAAGISQAEIARRLGVSAASVSLTLRGLQNPDMAP